MHTGQPPGGTQCDCQGDAAASLRIQFKPAQLAAHHTAVGAVRVVDKHREIHRPQVGIGVNAIRLASGCRAARLPFVQANRW